MRETFNGEASVGGLEEDDLHRLIYLNTWLTVGGAGNYWEVQPCLEQGHHEHQALRFQKTRNISQHLSPYLVLVDRYKLGTAPMPCLPVLMVILLNNGYGL